MTLYYQFLTPYEILIRRLMVINISIHTNKFVPTIKMLPMALQEFNKKRKT